MAAPSTRPRPVQPPEHPALTALRSAPLDDEPETEEERLAVAEARRDLAAGRTYSDAQLCALLGIDP